jgi:hypothetical protein
LLLLFNIVLEVLSNAATHDTEMRYDDWKGWKIITVYKLWAHWVLTGCQSLSLITYLNINSC